jgi:hypothetical protein
MAKTRPRGFAKQHGHLRPAVGAARVTPLSWVDLRRMGTANEALLCYVLHLRRMASSEVTQNPGSRLLWCNWRREYPARLRLVPALPEGHPADKGLRTASVGQARVLRTPVMSNGVGDRVSLCLHRSG